MCGKDRVRFDENEKNVTNRAFVTKKLVQDFLPFFKNLSGFSRLLPGLENLLGKFQDFFKNKSIL